MTIHLNRLKKMVQIRGHNTCFYAELTKIIPNYHQVLSLTKGSVDGIANSEDPAQTALIGAV